MLLFVISSEIGFIAVGEILSACDHKLCKYCVCRARGLGGGLIHMWTSIACWFSA